MSNENLIIEKEKLLSDIDRLFIEFINFIKPFAGINKETKDFFNYVIEMYEGFKQYKGERQRENGLLYIHDIGRSIGMYADYSGTGEFPWRVVDLYVGLISQYIDKLQNLPEHINT